MRKSRHDSRIAVWNAGYVNNPSLRDEEDRNAVILQIERGDGDLFIVEVVGKEAY